MREEFCKRVRVQLVSEGVIPYMTGLDNPARIVDAFAVEINTSDREKVAVMTVDAKCNLLTFSEVSCGTISSSLLSTREIVKNALLANATGVIIMHNHLSYGDVTPSVEDIAATRQLKDACGLMEIQLLDHIIVNPESEYYSFRESGLL